MIPLGLVGGSQEITNVELLVVLAFMFVTALDSGKEYTCMIYKSFNYKYQLPSSTDPYTLIYRVLTVFPASGISQV